MSEEPASSGSREPTKLDTAASNACTRSGAFALALSIVLCLLVPYWNDLPAENALGNYILYRFELTLDLDRLDHDPFWQEYKAANPQAVSVGIGSFPDHVPYSPPSGSQPAVESPQDTPSETPKPAPNKAKTSPAPGTPGDPRVPDDPPASGVQVAQVSAASPGCPGGPRLPKGVPIPLCPAPPSFSPSGQSIQKTRRAPATSAAPTGLTATLLVPIPELPDIIGVLKDLNKPGLLTKSRAYSSFYSFSIGRWAQRRSVLIYENAIRNKCVTPAIEKPYKKPILGNFVPEIEPDALVNCLSLSDIRELAAYEQPIIGNPDQIGRGTQRQIDVGIGALPQRIDQASIVAEVLLLFALLYFGAFVREAATSDRFPAPGTLFGAFSRSPFTLIVMLIVMCSPIASSLALAIASGRWYLYLGSGLVVLVTAFVFIEFHRGAYFNRLEPYWLWIWKISWWKRKATSDATAE